ncbi:MAG: hypothetical protein AABY33_07040 [Pseudomonadota bacterium]|jgi:hypothetical protein
MENLSREEARQVLILLTNDGVKFDGTKGLNGGDGKRQGALVFERDDCVFRVAYEKVAGMAGFGVVWSSSINSPGSKPVYEIINPELVKAMCRDCPEVIRKRGASVMY